ncbi:MAG: caa(3)-type oxidase, subunit [Myxococcales bacterium]|nr:caa(3)-type oxidase, subunit [Myxococcales bacterium]
MAHNDHAHTHSARPYILTFMWLCFCTVLTYTLAHKDLGAWSFAIAMAIAAAKGLSVILFFMHLYDQPGPSRLTLAIAFFFVLLVITLTLTDVHTRFPLSLPPGSFRSGNVVPPIQ